MRFFNLSRTTARAAAARRICQVPSPDQVALLALSDGEVVGCASYVTVGERVPGRQSGVAEIAFLAGNRGPGVGGTGDDRPEITRLDLSPVIAGPAGAIVMAARITVVPREPHDPFLRKLR